MRFVGKQFNELSSVVILRPGLRELQSALRDSAIVLFLSWRPENLRKA